MRWLLILAIVLPLAAKPVEPPKNKGSAESDSALNVDHDEPTKKNQEPSANGPPSTTQSPIPADSKETSIKANGETSATSNQTSNQELEIQRKLAWFTRALGRASHFVALCPIAK